MFLNQLFQNLAKFLMKKRGWQALGSLPKENCVIIFAPHTSNWDFFLLLTLGLSWKAVGEVSWLGKHQIFVGPIGFFLKFIGGIPVNRKKPGSLSSDLNQLYSDSHRTIRIALAPEGTRKGVSQFKRGFLHIARSAKVPIYLGAVNYSEKKMGIIGKLDYRLTDAQINAHLEKTYEANWAKYPEFFLHLESNYTVANSAYTCHVSRYFFRSFSAKTS